MNQVRTGASAYPAKRINPNNNRQLHQKHGLLGQTRTHILIWYSILMFGFLSLSIPIFSQLVLLEVNARVKEELNREFEAFEKFILYHNNPKKSSKQKQVKDLFNEFLYYHIPEDDNFLITILDGQFYRSSPRALPAIIGRDSALMQRFSTIRQQIQGEHITSDPSIGKILYIAKPVIREGKVEGIFVVAHINAGEVKEATDIIVIFIQLLLVLILVALILAWMVSGKVLSPLRSLSATARSISEIDLTQRLRVEGPGDLADLANTFNEMMERLQKAFITQREFISDAGHELRTPITIIRGHLELLEDDPNEVQETVALLLDELDRMSRMVEDLLLLAKSERPDFLQWETIDIDLLTTELFTKAQALAPRKWCLNSLAQGAIKGDRQRLTQAILNLAENATNYTKPTDTIEIGSSIEGKNLRLWVRDTGEGIAPKDHIRIFQRFARAENSRRTSEGAGLGLSIVKAITQAHGGRVELFSDLGVGSQFTLVLPLENTKFKSNNNERLLNRNYAT